MSITTLVLLVFLFFAAAARVESINISNKNEYVQLHTQTWLQWLRLGTRHVINILAAHNTLMTPKVFLFQVQRIGNFSKLKEKFGGQIKTKGTKLTTSNSETLLVCPLTWSSCKLKNN
jgi:hypothetical protein